MYTRCLSKIVTGYLTDFRSVRTEAIRDGNCSAIAPSLLQQVHHRSYAIFNTWTACAINQERSGKQFLKAYASGMMRTSLHGCIHGVPRKSIPVLDRLQVCANRGDSRWLNASRWQLLCNRTIAPTASAPSLLRFVIHNCEPRRFAMAKCFAMAIALQSHHRSYSKRTIAPSQ
ncbi:MAG: hypothetical protein ACI9CB_002962 [Rhodothermales bacterium]|jgi:hypothetical protein